MRDALSPRAIGAQDMSLHRVFFSFDYELDLHRVRRFHRLANIVSRAPGGFETSKVWQEARSRGEAELRGLIDDALMKTTVTVVCLGYKTAHRDYVRYAVERSLQQGNGLVGIKIDNLTDKDGAVETRFVAVPTEIEAAGYNIYSYTYAERLIAQIEEAYELSKIDHAKRVARDHKSEVELPEQDRREEQRVPSADGVVRIDDITCPLKNWNSRGFRATQYAGDCNPGDKAIISFSIPIADKRLEISCQATVLGINPETQELVGLFVGMDPASKQELTQRLQALLPG